MKYETGKRLEKVADLLYEGNRSELARNLKMKPQALTRYVKGDSMPGGLILIRLHEIGININWFLTGEGEALLESYDLNVKEPIKDYLANIESDLTEGTEKETLEEVKKFSEVLKEMDISASLQRAMLLIYVRHLEEEKDEK